MGAEEELSCDLLGRVKAIGGPAGEGTATVVLKEKAKLWGKPVRSAPGLRLSPAAAVPVSCF